MTIFIAQVDYSPEGGGGIMGIAVTKERAQKIIDDVKEEYMDYAQFFIEEWEIGGECVNVYRA